MNQVTFDNFRIDVMMLAGKYGLNEIFCAVVNEQTGRVQATLGITKEAGKGKLAPVIEFASKQFNLSNVGEAEYRIPKKESYD